MTRWLEDDELRAWLKLAGVMLKLSPALDSQLQREFDLTHFDYLCLAMLSEEPDHTTTMSALAARTNASLSRLSHVISKLEKRGWVSRCRSDVSRRVTLVTMTEAGYAVLVDAAPGHVETVKSRTAGKVICNRRPPFVKPVPSSASPSQRPTVWY